MRECRGGAGCQGVTLPQFGPEALCLPLVRMDCRVKSPAVTRREACVGMRGVRRVRALITFDKLLDREKPQPSYNAAAEKVSQAAGSPRLNPVENQRLRCAEVPWVKESGIA